VVTWDFSALSPYKSIILHGIGETALVSVLSFALACVLGLIAYLGCANHLRPVRVISSIYVEVIRNIPMLVVLFFIYFGLGEKGLNFSPFWAAVAALAINNGAYLAEIFRAGFQAVPSGLHEAASALGLGPFQTFRHVTFMPGIRNIIPAATNQFIMLMLFSSVASTVAFPDLTYELQRINSATLRTFEVFTVGAALYYVLSTAIALAAGLLSRRMYRW
jgi:polar amino acid transport system permease protein